VQQNDQRDGKEVLSLLSRLLGSLDSGVVLLLLFGSLDADLVVLLNLILLSLSSPLLETFEVPGSLKSV
jgi:hypothetical protein